MRNKFIHKGVSSIIGAIIAIAIVLSILTSLTLFGFGAFSVQQQSIDYARSIELARQIENLIIRYNTTAYGSTVIDITNNGSTRVDIKSLVYRDTDGNSYILDLWLVALNVSQVTSAGIYLRGISKGGVYNVTMENGYVYLLPSGFITFEISGEVYPVSIVTSTGNIIKVPQEVSTTQLTYATVAGSVIMYPINLGSFEDLGNRTDISIDPDLITPPTSRNLGAGMYTYNAHYEIFLNLGNVDIQTSNEFRFGSAIIGFSSETTANGQRKYNILITGPYNPDASSWWCPNNIDINGTSFCLDSMSSQYPYESGWRIKILGFVPDNENGLHIYYISSNGVINVDSYGSDAIGMYYYANTNSGAVSDAYLYLKGHADKVIIYLRKTGQEEFSYDPYFISADIDGNGIVEWYFMTEDTYYGDLTYISQSGRRYEYYSYNDAFPSARGYPLTSCTSLIFDDWSAKPFILNLTGYIIDGRNVAMVLVAFRMFFHDNNGLDVKSVDQSNIPLIGVYLIDANTGDIVSSREFDYQELMNLEDTYPPNENFFVETVSLIVPNESSNYYIGIMFNDPYGDYCVGTTYLEYYDDLDLTIGIEWIGITLLARP